MPETPSTHPTDNRLQRDDRPVDAYADRLIDDVFQDVDRLLDSTTQLPQEPADPKPLELKPIQIPPIVVQPLVAPAAETKPEAQSVPVTVDSESEEKAKTDKSFLWFDRLLLGGAFVSLVVVLALWLLDRGLLKNWFSTAETDAETAQPAPVMEDPQVVANAEFSNYLGQALDRIENRTPELPESETDALPAIPPDVATLSIPVNPTSPNTVAQSLSRIANALERVSTTPVPLPELPGDLENADDPTPPTVDPDDAVAVSPPPIPVEVSPELLPEPAPEPASEPAPSSVTPEAKEPTETASRPVPTDVYALVGTLERGEGDRPAALFEINGSPQWVDLGEPIASSGWTLVEVTGDRVSLRRNGEVRSIYVGQQF